jgi:hypothetical protein
VLSPTAIILRLSIQLCKYPAIYVSCIKSYSLATNLTGLSTKLASASKQYELGYYVVPINSKPMTKVKKNLGKKYRKE